MIFIWTPFDQMIARPGYPQSKHLMGGLAGRDGIERTPATWIQIIDPTLAIASGDPPALPMLEQTSASIQSCSLESTSTG